MQTTKTDFGPTAAKPLTILGPNAIDRRPWRPVAGCPGVRALELWRSADGVDALIAYQPGAATPGGPHPVADHHVWIVSGSASIGGRRVVAGSYVHVPPGVAHRIEHVGAEGCTLLQIHRRCRPADTAAPPMTTLGL